MEYTGEQSRMEMVSTINTAQVCETCCVLSSVTMSCPSWWTLLVAHTEGKCVLFLILISTHAFAGTIKWHNKMWQWVSTWTTCCKHNYKQENAATGNCLQYAKIFPLASVSEVSSSMKLRFTEKQTKKSYSNATHDQPPTQYVQARQKHRQNT